MHLLCFCQVAKLYPSAELVLRMRCDSATAQCNLGMKFGVMPGDVQPLLAFAAQLQLHVVGVAFHVGSGCSEPEIFLRAIKEAKQVSSNLTSAGRGWRKIY